MSAEASLLDNFTKEEVAKYMLQIHEAIDPNCKRCYGRGYDGVNRNLKMKLICGCIVKQAKKKNTIAEDLLKRYNELLRARLTELKTAK